MNQPLVSIITPCYNGASYLDGYFSGIMSQKHRNIELIFVDDGSKDNTAEIAKRYGEELESQGMRFLYIYQDNAGQAAAINKGLQVFTGEYLTWLDSDDIMLPDNISLKLEHLISCPECGFALSGIQIVDYKNPEKVIKIKMRRKPMINDNLFEDYIYCNNIVWGPGTVLVRRECLIEAIPDLNIYESREGQNWQLMLPLSYLFSCCYVEEPLLTCIQHSDSHSRINRTLEEEIKREENFIVLCTETVKKIPHISSNEVDKWSKEIYIIHNKNIMSFFIGKDRKKYYELLKKLKEVGYRTNYRDIYFLKNGKRIYQQWKHKI